jgi:hypothetical protein
MRVTQSMVEAARRAEFDYYQRNRLLSERPFIPTPDPVIRAMLEAALADTPADPAPSSEGPERPRIVTARKPRPRR